MEKEFVSYTQALAFKELGFDEHCFGFYSDKTGEDTTIYTVSQVQATINSMSIRFNTGSASYQFSAAPLYQQAFRWFRQNYGLYHNIWNLTHGEPTDLIPNGFAFSIDEYWITIIGKNELGYFKKYYETYEEAESACLDKLMEIVKTNNIVIQS